MNKFLTIAFYGLLTMMFVGCSDGYKQQYASFNDYSKINQRNKGWFPDIINPDAYDLKNVSYLDSLCAFGTFKYTENNFYDSLFKSPNVKQIDFSIFENKVNEHQNRKPDWFLYFDKVSKTNIKTIQMKQFYIARIIDKKTIFFVLTN